MSLKFGPLCFEYQSLRIGDEKYRRNVLLDTEKVTVSKLSDETTDAFTMSISRIEALTLEFPSMNFVFRIIFTAIAVVLWPFGWARSATYVGPILGIAFYLRLTNRENIEQINSPGRAPTGARFLLDFPLKSMNRRTRDICSFWIEMYVCCPECVCMEEQFRKFEKGLGPKSNRQEFEEAFRQVCSSCA